MRWPGALTKRLDGTQAAATTIARKRAVLHGALGYAVKLGLLPANPLPAMSWRAPRATQPADPGDRDRIEVSAGDDRRARDASREPSAVE